MLQDHLLIHRFDQITHKLDLTNLANDEGTNSHWIHHLSNMFKWISLELSSLGIFAQTNKHAFMRGIIDIINKDLPMVRPLLVVSISINTWFSSRHAYWIWVRIILWVSMNFAISIYLILFKLVSHRIELVHHSHSNGDMYFVVLNSS